MRNIGILTFINGRTSLLLSRLYTVPFTAVEMLHIIRCEALRAERVALLLRVRLKIASKSLHSTLV